VTHDLCLTVLFTLGRLAWLFRPLAPISRIHAVEVIPDGKQACINRVSY
jgi:hypothetical protein